MNCGEKVACMVPFIAVDCVEGVWDINLEKVKYGIHHAVLTQCFHLEIDVYEYVSRV